MLKLAKLSDKSKHTEIDGTTRRIIREYNNCGITTDEHLQKIFDLLSHSLEELTKAINRIKTKSGLEELDNVRNELINSIDFVLKGFIHNPLDSLSNPAKSVMGVFKHYGLKIKTRNYSEKSSLISSLINDFDKESVRQYTDLLPGLNILVEHLRQAQRNFVTERVKYESKKGEESKLVNATTQKTEVRKLINDELVTYLRAMYQVNKDKYGKLAQTVSRIIYDNNLEVKKRSKKFKANEEKTI